MINIQSAFAWFFSIRTLVYFSIYVGLFAFTFYFIGLFGKDKTDKPKGKLKFPSVSVIIPAYNEEKTLEKTVESVVNLNYPKGKLEVLIINDGSSDGTSRIGRELEKKYKIVKLFEKKNGGKGSALNFGIKQARGELVAVFDADSTVDKEALVKMIPYFDDERVVCVTPAMKVYNPKGILQRVQKIEYDMAIFLRKVFANLNSIHVTPGPFSVFKKEFFEKHGGFDENNITEDLEMALRIQSLNYKIENSPYSIVYTIPPAKFRALTIQRRRWYFGWIKNFSNYKHLFGRKYGEFGIVVLPLAVLSIVVTVAVSLYYLFNGIYEYSRQLSYFAPIGFDFMNTLRFKWYLLNLNLYDLFSNGLLFFAVVFFFGTLLTLIIVNRKLDTKENPISTFISYILFIILYSLMYSFWWVISIIYSLFKKEVSWR